MTLRQSALRLFILNIRHWAANVPEQLLCRRWIFLIGSQTNANIHSKKYIQHRRIPRTKHSNWRLARSVKSTLSDCLCHVPLPQFIQPDNALRLLAAATTNTVHKVTFLDKTIIFKIQFTDKNIKNANICFSFRNIRF